MWIFGAKYFHWASRIKKCRLMVSRCFRSVLSYYYSYIYPLQNIQEQQALIARLAEQQEQEQEEQDAQPSNRGRKRSAWGELEQQGKKVCTASIQVGGCIDYQKQVFVLF